MVQLLLLYIIMWHLNRWWQLCHRSQQFLLNLCRAKESYRKIWTFFIQWVNHNNLLSFFTFFLFIHIIVVIHQGSFELFFALTKRKHSSFFLVSHIFSRHFELKITWFFFRLPIVIIWWNIVNFSDGRKICHNNQLISMLIDWIADWVQFGRKWSVPSFVYFSCFLFAHE